MSEEQERFLTLLGHAPARLTVEQTAWVLNCQTHDVPILVAARLLRPLGNPPPNGTKYFSTADVLELTKDRSWLGKITNTVCLHWQKKNARKRGGPVGDRYVRAICRLSMGCRNASFLEWCASPSSFVRRLVCWPVVVSWQ